MLYTFERRGIDPNHLCGAIVAESEDLILVHRIYDLEFDGFIVIRRRDVSKSYSSESDEYCERLMRKEGLWKSPPKWVRLLPITDWPSLFSALIDKPVIIENERQGDFFIGPIVASAEHSVQIHYFDGAGTWMEVERVQFRRIAAVQFGDRYSTIHYRHLPPRPETSL